MPYTVRPTPISRPNRQGPSKSPINLGTPRPFSANREDHWDIESSAAPAQSIISSMIQKIRIPASFRMGSPCVSSSAGGGARGIRMTRKRLTRGTAAHSSGYTHHTPSPVIPMQTVVVRMTSTWPQE